MSYTIDTTPRITGSDSAVRPSERDAVILAERAAARAKIPGPRVGDFVIRRDGTMARFAHAYPDALQPTVHGFGFGSHYLCGNGAVSFSGALDPSIRREHLEPTDEVRMGEVWFFHNDSPCAHSAIRAVVPCRVFREVGVVEGGAD